MDETALEAAIGDLREFVRPDGANIFLENADFSRDSIEIRLDLSGVECLDCVLPAPVLDELISTRIHKELPGITVVIHDPRVIAPEGFAE